MPRKPKKPCRYPNCPELTENTYCEKHRQEMEKQYNKYKRDRGAQKFYQSKEWKAVRRVKLNNNPLCEECMRQGKYVRATMVDHIVPIKQGGKALDIQNLQSLCNSCHSKKSIEEGSRFG